MGHPLVSFNESTFAWLLLDDIHSHSFKYWLCCRKRDLFQGPRVGSCLTLRNELSEETCAEKARDFIGKGYSGKEQQSKGTQENCSVVWLVVSGFMVIGLLSRLSLASHSDSGSFLVLFSLLVQDRFQWEGFWEIGRTYGLMSPVSFWCFTNSSGWW